MSTEEYEKVGASRFRNYQNFEVKYPSLSVFVVAEHPDHCDYLFWTIALSIASRSIEFDEAGYHQFSMKSAAPVFSSRLFPEGTYHREIKITADFVAAVAERSTLPVVLDITAQNYRVVDFDSAFDEEE